MSFRLPALRTFAAMWLAVAGAVSARDASHGPLSPQSTPEVVFGKGDVSDFSALIHRNRNGHIIRITRGTVTQSFARGPGGRITAATSNVTGAPSYAYPNHDAQGRRTKAVTNRGDWDYTYRGGVNGDGQLQEADHSGPGNWDFVYNTDGIGRRISVSNPASNGNLLANDDWEDPLNQFLSTQWTQQRVLRASLDREADIEITESHALPTLIPGLAPDPQAPPLRDIVFPLTAPGTQGGWTAWSITGTLEGGGDPGAAPDRKAKLAGLTWFPPAEETFTYDAAGNRSGSARWNYTYDGLNRLTRAVNKDLATAPEAYDVLFTYDAEGRRHSKTSKRYSNGSLKGETHTTWIWDGWHPVVERVLDAKSNKPIVERKLVWGPDLSGQPGGAGGAGGLLLIRETNHSFDGRPPVTTDLLPLYDGSGNIIGLANPAGELLAEYWYGPFGELLEATGPKADSNPWRWATKSLDKETGLVYFGLRYYDPTTGQWLSREPLGEGESLNLYAYCHNDPINRVDVLGAAEVKFSPALEGLHGNAEFQALFTVAWSGSQVTSGFPYAPSDWVFWRHKLGKLVNSVAEPFYEEWSDEDQIRRGREVSAVIADYETVFGEIIAGTRSAETAFHNRVRAQEAALKATPGYWVKTVAGDLRDAGQLATGFAMDTVTVPLGGARFRPWTHPLDQWQDVSGGERAFATAEFLLLPTAFLPTNASSRIISFGSHADDAARMSMAWGRRANNLMISSPGGGLRAIAAGAADLSPSQASVLAALPGYGASVIIPKRGFGLIDLSALSAKTGHEFAMFTTGGRRLLIRGNAATVPITPELGAIMARQGWRWSAHVHPDFVLRASQGDMDVLAPFFRSGRNNSSAILDPFGGRSRFSPAGDMVDSTWLPR